MAKKVRSARGVEVDFDLLKIKQQLTESPSVDVSARENFVEKRLRRRTKRTVVPTKVAAELPVDDEIVADDAENIDGLDLTEDQPVDAPAPRPVRKTRNA